MTTLLGPERPDLLKDEFLHDIFIFTATRFPNKVALHWQNEQITYRQVYEQALYIAFVLRRTKQIGSGSIVAIHLRRSAQIHVIILAVLMTGATYVPLDADTPPERVSEVVADLEAVLLLVDSSTSLSHPLAINVETLSDYQVTTTDDSLSVHIDVNSPAYIICTSGSTGKPKSIAISHRNICHLVRADNEIMQIRHDDIVYQGSSAAFDMFLEETFLTYLVGGTLVIASKSDILNSDRLHHFFIKHSITVLFCVPTLLLLMHNDSALKLRLINTGGEACPQVLVDRWWKEDRLLFNSYGPTETTVSATAILLQPDDPISIGTPLPNYVCRLLDETTGQLTSANTGELCINGPGVALGYVRRNSLTKEKFTEYGYRTGDRVTIDNGRIFFHERIDSQVKIRGFRIELDEIEQELLRIDDRIQSAAVTVHNERLIAFVVGQLTESHMRQVLAKRLPHYMIPDRLITLNEPMPCLISGKMDRKALVTYLPKDDIEQRQTDRAMIDTDMYVARTHMTQNVDHSPINIIMCAFQQSFPHVQPTENDDFFLDLGGHSMIAALTITRLREWFPAIALQDLYECKTAAKLAAHLTSKTNMKDIQNNPILTNKRVRPTQKTYVMCSVVQAFVLFVLVGVASLEFLLPYLFFDLMLSHSNLTCAYLVAYGTFVVIPPFRWILAIVVKWTIIGRYREGDFPLWGTMYLRWWTVEQFRRIAVSDVLANTPFMATYYRCLGARIGRNVHLGNIICSATDLLEIGNGTTLSSNVYVQTAFVDDYMLKFRRVYIYDDVYIGGNSVLAGQTKMEDHSELGDMSALLPNTCVPSYEAWRGSPATYCHHTSPLQTRSDLINYTWTYMYSQITFALIILLIIPLMYFLPMIPGLTLFEYFNDPTTTSWMQFIIFSPVVGILYTCLVVLEIILMHYLLVRNITVGVYSTSSSVYVRKWMFDRLFDIALHVIHTFYATLYITSFLRALGMKIGHRCEISTATGMIPSLVEVGEQSFIADSVTLADPLIHRNQIHFRKTVIGRRVFIGNSAVIPDGIHIPDNCLVGCLSIVPDELQEGQSCLGSPAIILPKRAEISKEISEDLTYQPRSSLILKRFCIDTIRIFFPRIIIILEIGFALEFFSLSSDSIGVGLSLFILPVLYMFVFAIPSLLVCISLKWLIIGKYKSNQYPMWTWFIWTSEFITAIYEQLAVPMVLDFLRGTFFMAPVLRCFGVNIGRGCFVDTTDITEFDLIRIGDYVVLNTRVGLQTHLFEDRVMKIAEVCVEDDATIGCASIMLPNTRLGRSAKLGSLSLMIKGEGILPDTSWQGIPIRAVDTNNNQTHCSC